MAFAVVLQIPDGDEFHFSEFFIENCASHRVSDLVQYGQR